MKLRFIVPFPDTDYYLSQILIQNNNFEKFGYDVETHFVAGICYGKINPHLQRIVDSGLLKSTWHIYFDERTGEERRYSASLKDHLMYRYFKEFPEEKDNYYFLADPDMIFLEPFDFTPYMDGKTWWGSDTSSYMNLAYFRQKGEGFFEEMCDHVGISPELVIANDKNIIGANYLTVNNTAEFWERIYKKAAETYNWLGTIQPKYFKPEMGFWFQSFCTEMFLIIWELWKDGVETKHDENWNFHWTNSWVKDKKHKIFHLAGEASQDQSKTVHYAKRAYEHRSPFNKDYSMIHPDSLTNLYINEIVETARKYPSLVWD